MKRSRHGYGTKGKESPTYIVWKGMKQRCYYKRHVGYHNYGGRGVGVCARWRDSFENFLEDMGERPAGKTLDRICSDCDYSKENCRWATRAEQRANTRNLPAYDSRAAIAKVLKMGGLKPRQIAAAIDVDTVKVQSLLHSPMPMDSSAPAIPIYPLL